MSKLTLYADKIFSATDLNQRSGVVLDTAYENPVTIIRNEQHFALLRRETANCLSIKVEKTKTIVDAFSAAFRVLTKENIANSDSYAWLNIFDEDEIKDFIRELREVFSSVHHSDNSEDWDLIDAIIHEWEETSFAVRDPDIDYALAEMIDDVASGGILSK
jgi:hypothetical protein